MKDLRPVLPGNASHETTLVAGASVFTGRNIFSLARHCAGKLIPSDSNTLVCQSKRMGSPAAAPRGAARPAGSCAGTGTIPVHPRHRGRIQTCPPASAGRGRACVRTRKAIAAENERKGKV